MAVTPVSGINLLYWNMLPMGVSNYGGDLQVYNLQEYLAGPPRFNLNLAAQCNIATQIYRGIGGGWNVTPDINMGEVQALAQAWIAPIAQQQAGQQFSQASGGASSIKTKLNSMLLNKSATAEDRQKMNDYLSEVDKLEKELQELKNNSEITAQEVFDKSFEIEKQLRKIATDVGNLSSAISQVALQAAQQASLQTQTENTTTSQAKSASSTDGVLLNKKGNGYGPEFLEKVKQIANRLNCNYRDLLGLMNSESGIRADIKNPHGSASGLIQFVESTASKLGTTTAQLRQMSPIRQLDYVERYLMQAKQNAGLTGQLSAGDLYSLVFLPGRAKREVLTTSGENYYKKNKGLDANKDGSITKAELGARVQSKYVSDKSFLA
ncbi:MAG: hypothetical protein E7Z87_07610 [Cyanobacteria bacterium SIG26]|nr:hypothetical protein [Cyanobacteria bacterium SIG26]